MPVGPELVAQIAAQVTAVVLEQLSANVEAQAEDWPDYDEYPDPENVEPIRTEVVGPVEVAPANHSMRARVMHGTVEAAPVIDEPADDGVTEQPWHDPMTREVGGGYDVAGNDAWLTRQFQKEVVLAKKAIPVEDMPRQVGVR